MPKAKKYVLIAEDDLFLSRMMEKALADKGVKTAVVHDGAQTVKTISAKAPDLLLLDLLMPTIDGYGVLKHLQETKADFPIVIVSNVSDRNDQEKCKKLGCRAYLVKSDMDDDALWPAITKYLK